VGRLAESAPVRFVSDVAPCESSRAQGAIASTIVILHRGFRGPPRVLRFIPVVTARRMM